MVAIVRVRCILALACLQHWSTEATEELTGSNFDAVVGNGMEKTWFVSFYSPGCGHCKRLAPIWDQLAEKLQGKVMVGKVDATEEVALADEWDVSGYPTLFLISAGKSYRFKGPRNLESLEAFALGGFKELPKEKASEKAPAEGGAEAYFGSPEVTILTGQNFDDVLRRQTAPGETSPWFVVFYLRSCGFCRTLEAGWAALAKELKGKVHVGGVDAQANRPLAERWGVGRFPSMKLVAGDSVFDYEGERTVEALKAFALGGFRAQSASSLPPRLHASEGAAPAAGEAELRGESGGRLHIVIGFAAGMLFAAAAWAAWCYCSRCCQARAAPSPKGSKAE
eukprot:TRINITY_DN48428_c0_g1_i1.p1 TRINITY_DN48428_c0_g1~~TRINITY_DN48428_c0_g1_i1.p1  ORF type:complete len:338 (+),score=81.06 TRINITY_DN48428_c0_g1_i1:77-1090(+)